jgi:hypothetical protein
MGYIHDSDKMKRNLSHMLGGTKNVIVAAPEAVLALGRLIEERGHTFSNALSTLAAIFPTPTHRRKRRFS